MGVKYKTGNGNIKNYIIPNSVLHLIFKSKKSCNKQSLGVSKIKHVSLFMECTTLINSLTIFTGNLELNKEACLSTLEPNELLVPFKCTKPI